MLTILLAAAVRGAVFLVAVWLVLKALRLRDPVVEKNAWTCVAAAGLLMPLLAWLAGAVTPPLPVFALPELASHPASATTVLSGTLTAEPGSRVALMATGLYLMGATLFLARLATGLWMGERLRRHATRVSVLATEYTDVRVSAAIGSPASFASSILLPPHYRTWDQATLRAVLAHEQAHIRHHDAYRLWLMALYRALFWFNPLVHWLHWRLHVLAELTSDEAAAASVGDRAKYAATLQQLASSRSFIPATVPMADSRSLNRRLRHLSGSSVPTAPRTGAWKAVLIGAMVATAVLAIAPWTDAMAPAGGSLAKLEFHLVDEQHDARQAQNTGQVPSADRLYLRTDGTPDLLKRTVVATGSDVMEATVTTTTAGPTVQIQLNSQGAAAMLRATRENIGHRMAAVLDGRVISDATIRGAFGPQFEVTGLTVAQAHALAMQVGQAMRNARPSAALEPLPGLPAIAAGPKVHCKFTGKTVLNCLLPADPSLCLVSTSCAALESSRPRACPAGDRSCEVKGRVVPLTAYKF